MNRAELRERRFYGKFHPERHFVEMLVDYERDS